MPKRTLTISLLQASVEVRGKTRLLDLQDIDGHDVLELFKLWIQDPSRSTMKNKENEHYTTVSHGRAAGRSVLLEGLHGRTGSPGVTVDTINNSVAHTREDSHAATIPTRSILVVPESGTVAAFLIERQSNSGSGVAILTAFRNHLASLFSKVTFFTETFQQSDLWLQNANLLSVTAVEYVRPLDLGSGTSAETVVGRLETKFRPPKGTKWLPRMLVDLFAKGDLSADAALTIPDEDKGEVLVELSLDDQKKTYTLGDSRAPGFRYLLNEDGEQPLTDEEFLNECRTQVGDCYRRLGERWESKWLDRSILETEKLVGAVS